MLMVLAMVFSLISTTAFATGEETVLEKVPEDAIQSGSCGSGYGPYGSNAEFYISADGQLVIYGTGEIGNMAWDGANQPWKENRDKIISIGICQK